MARKKKPKILGTDPSYTSDFTEYTRLPTNKPPEVQEPKAAPEPQSEPAQQTEKTVPAPRTRKPKAKPTKSAEPEKTDAPEPAKHPGSKREITLTAAVKVEQHKKLEDLEGKGLAQKDVIALAGRRAIERFDPKPEFVDKPEAERGPMREGYRSSKRIDAAMIDRLRNQQDPLRLSSDAAMVRGQFEILFWSCLDEVIEELNSKY